MKKIYLFFVFYLFFFSTVSAETISCPGNKQIDQLIDKGTALNNEGGNKEALKLFQKANDLAKAIGCEKGELNATRSIMMFYFNTYDYKKHWKYQTERESWR